MDGDAELEEINTFTSLDYLIVEFGANVGALDVVWVAATRLLIREKKHVKVIVDFWTAVLESSLLSPDHQNDQDQVARHINDS